MAKHITSTGAFYGYRSHGLGRVVGMAAGALTTLAYVVFEAALFGIFAFFASTFVSAHMGPDVNWISFAVLILGVNALLTYFDINITAKILVIFLITEILDRKHVVEGKSVDIRVDLVGLCIIKMKN